jgi:phosphoenolpyruvate carboxykinase (ATP)
MSNSPPKNIVLLTCDARGILPPVSKLDSATLQYHFISGYTSKTPGTEEGITEPVSTFSACFGQPFLVLHPMKYADMLADKLTKFGAKAYLINTGWVGGAAGGKASRCPLKYTRAILDAIHSGELADAETETMPVFNLQVPKKVTGVPDEILNPTKSWLGTASEFDNAVKDLAQQFRKNFEKYADRCTKEVISAQPDV